MFHDAEVRVQQQVLVTARRFASQVLGGPASRIYSCWEKLETFDAAEELTREMIRLAYGGGSKEVEEYLAEMKEKLGKI